MAMLRYLHLQTETSESHHRTPGIIVRPLVAADAGLIEAMHQRLSPTTIYYRYLQYRRPTPAELAAICQLDPARGAGFVAAVQDEPAAIVGLVYYVREAHAAAPTAEPGILVEDRFQEQGIGRRLWQQLQWQAQREGLRWLRVWSHPDNHRMTQLVRGGGFPYTAKIYDGLSEYLVALGKQSMYAVKGKADQQGRSTRGGQWRHVNDRLCWKPFGT